MKMNDIEKEIYNYLDKTGVKYFSFNHSVANTLDEKLENDRKAGVSATHCKNLFLCNRQKTSFYLLIMPFEKVFRTSEVSKQLNSSRLSFAPEDALMTYLNTTPGKVSPLELIFDTSGKVKLAVDIELKSAERLCFHPGIDTTTVVLDNEQFFGVFLPKIHKKPIFVRV